MCPSALPGALTTVSSLQFQFRLSYITGNIVLVALGHQGPAQLAQRFLAVLEGGSCSKLGWRPSASLCPCVLPSLSPSSLHLSISLSPSLRPSLLASFYL